MKINEFTHGPTNTPESNLLTALELIQHRYKDKEKVPNVSTQSLINLVRNTDRTFDYEALAQANETNPAVKNLIKSFNKDFVNIGNFFMTVIKHILTLLLCLICFGML